MSNFLEVKRSLDPVFNHCPEGKRVPLYVVIGGEVDSTFFPDNSYHAAQIIDRKRIGRFLVGVVCVDDIVEEYEEMGWDYPEKPYAVAFRVTGQFPSTPTGAVESASAWVAESLYHGFPSLKVHRFQSGDEFYVVGYCPDLADYDADTVAVIQNRLKRIATNAIQAASDFVSQNVIVHESPAYPIPEPSWNREGVVANVG